MYSQNSTFRYKNTPANSNHWFVINEDNQTIGVVENKTSYLIGDRVKVSTDGHGYIAPGITFPGMGKIVQINEDTTDQYYGVKMDNGQFGFVKSARIRVV